MDITEVRVKLIQSSGDRLKAFCSVTFDGEFVVRDLKIIEGANGEFVAMPSRKLADRCEKCAAKNHLRARYCNECGAKLNDQRASRDRMGRTKLHADVAHPINAGCRERIQEAVLEAYQDEREAAKKPDYAPKKYDGYEEDDARVESSSASEKPEPEENVEEYPSHETTSTDARDKEYDFEERDDANAGGSDYDSLIRELKQDAEKRRKGQASRGFDRKPSPRQREPRQEETEVPSYGRLNESPDEADDAVDVLEPKAEETPKPSVPAPAPVLESTEASQPTEAAKPKQDEDDPMAGFGAGIL